MDDSMEKQVLVSIRTTAKDEDGNPEGDMRMVVPGVLSRHKNGSWVLRYSESIDQEDGTVLTADVRLKLEDGHVVMLRKGEYGAMMVFSRGQRYEGSYHTPYGDLGMAVFTTRLLTSLGPEGGKVLIDYQLDMNGGFASMRHMKLEYGPGAMN